MQGSLLLPVDSLNIGSLEQEQGEHINMAIVGSVMEGSLPSTITNVKVTKMRDKDLCKGKREEDVRLQCGLLSITWSGALANSVCSLLFYLPATSTWLL